MLRSYKSLSTLQWALGLSVLLHAALLTVRFVDPEGFRRLFQETTLDVVLVNAESDQKPDKAQAIAQSSLAGGGEAADKRIASTPLAPSPREAPGDAPASGAAPQRSPAAVCCQAQRLGNRQRRLGLVNGAQHLLVSQQRGIIRRLRGAGLGGGQPDDLLADHGQRAGYTDNQHKEPDGQGQPAVNQKPEF